MKTHVKFRQNPEELKSKLYGTDIEVSSLPWKIKQILISKEYFHAWLFSNNGREFPITGCPISNIEITEDDIIVTFNDSSIETEKEKNPMEQAIERMKNRDE